MQDSILNKLEDIQRELSTYEKKGLDTSSLKIFIRNFKEFIKLNEPAKLISPEELTFDKKLEIIKSFLEDKKAFLTIIEVIQFANDRLQLDFKDQKESREITIARIIGRIKTKPELKDKLKLAVLSLRNEIVHTSRSSRSRKQIITAETFSKWAEIIKNI